MKDHSNRISNYIISYVSYINYIAFKQAYCITGRHPDEDKNKLKPGFIFNKTDHTKLINVFLNEGEN